VISAMTRTWLGSATVRAALWSLTSIVVLASCSHRTGPSDARGVDHVDPEAAHAARLCRKYTPTTTSTTWLPGATIVTSISVDVAGGASTPVTAGEITSVAKRILGHTLPPWDTLPPGHFVALCSFESDGVHGPTSTVCPDGDLAVGAPGLWLYVDDQGRTSEDPLLRALPISALCDS
jgi:hypothetical protein